MDLKTIDIVEMQKTIIPMCALRSLARYRPNGKPTFLGSYFVLTVALLIIENIDGW